MPPFAGTLAFRLSCREDSFLAANNRFVSKGAPPCGERRADHDSLSS
jgi:hypothetical protein